MGYLEEIKAHGRWLGEEVIATHQISNFAFVETKSQDGRPNFSILVDDKSIGRGIDSLDHAILMALAYKYDRSKIKDAVSWPYAARVLQMVE